MSGDATDLSGMPRHAQDLAPTSPARRRARRVLTALAGMMLLVIGSTVAYAGYWYYRIDHNIKGAPLHGAASPVPNLIQEGPDAFGNLPLNILVIGTDARLPGKDSSLGGYTDTSGRADVEMLVHVAADRSNATVVSLPRDTMVPIPACVDAKGNQYGARSTELINSALAAGPGCQVDTVESFTHIKIDHFVMVDFSGVVDLTNAVGGVPVCVTQAVHDPDSHLDLPAGTSVIQGEQALAFLRTREGFANGSDLYRTQAQHQYLSALIRKMKEQATLDDPLQATHLMDVASKALTVDDPIASVGKLLDLSNTMKKVPTNRITFMTMPTTAYRPDPNRVAPDQALDDQIFSLIAHDESVTAPSAASSPTTKPSPTVSITGPAPSTVKDSIVVENGTSASGRSKQLADTLRTDGFRYVTGVGYARSDVSRTMVSWTAGHEEAAKSVAAALQLPYSAVASQPGTDGSGPVVVLVGADFASGDVFNPNNLPSGGLPSDLASNAAILNAGDAGQCVTARSG